MASRARFEIWEDDSYPLLPWRAQMIDYVAYFKTKEQAEGYIAAVKKYRETWGLK